METRDNRKSKHLIVSYPRSGSNFFQLAWKEKNNEHIQCIRTSQMIKTIEEDNSLKIIGLIRNPIDSITSRILINKTHEKFFEKDETAISFALSEYAKIYQFIIDRADFVVDLSNFDKIDIIIETILNSSSTAADQENIKNSLNNIKNYSPSFISHEDYDSVRKVTESHDLKIQNNLYRLAYRKRMMV
jgi:hypothetical protein